MAVCLVHYGIEGEGDVVPYELELMLFHQMAECVLLAPYRSGQFLGGRGPGPLISRAGENLGSVSDLFCSSGC